MADYDIAAAFEAIENELIDSMMKNFARHRAEENKEGYLWSQWQAEQLKSLEQYRRQNEKKFTAKFSQLNGKVADMLRRAKADGSAAQEADILQAIQGGFKGYATAPANSPSATFFRLNDRKLDALIKATTDDLKSAETAVLRMSNDRYRKAIFNAQVYANTGAATYEKAVDMACRDMLRAGLNCVEYKNGARHTLSDYAHMAIRTANKRAYLYGEGQKRQQWGISTVVVNGRRGGCPLCTPYIGRVFIDDVYSGGKRDVSSGKAYPLLSEAIKSGLFHPNCKDSTSTYYEGITTLQPVTEEEQAEMERREQLEAKESYCKNEAKKNRRIAKYSLDADNKRIYSHRAEVFEQKAQNAEKALANLGESGIIKVGGNNKPRNKRLEEVIHKCIENDNSIFADGLLGKNAKSIIPEQGYYDIVAHGTPNTAQLFGVDVTPEILANILKHREDYKKGLSIRLISCKTGITDSRGLCFAQRLADILDVDVKAPTETIWVFPSGRFSVGTKYNSHDGRMKVFKPRRRE